MLIRLIMVQKPYGAQGIIKFIGIAFTAALHSCTAENDVNWVSTVGGMLLRVFSFDVPGTLNAVKFPAFRDCIA